ncbi:MAG TPA: class I SAM-dependent methyltransferase [Bacteroidia bacterium]|jgi:2-polyprenyl-3-methyl-5-hydroxy-6-metoxy-1,4-benzoquinol methylase|nr:class I SAM-dependent methyltransferase [Bacteroidia bacterium]
MNEQQHLVEIGKTYSMFDKDQKVNAFRSRTILEYTTGPKVLELGCADGLVTELLCRHFKGVVAVDASEELLAKARVRAPEATYHQALFEQFEPGTTFDTVILGHVLEHVQDPIAILQIIQKWVAPKGKLIITVPNGNSVHRRIGVEMGMLKYPTELNEDDIRIGHRRVFTVETLRTAVLSSGLNILKEEGILLKPLSNRQMFDWPDTMLEAYYTLAKKLPAEFGGELCFICSKA